MHRAPAVSVSVTKSRWHVVFIAALSILAVLPLAVLLFVQPQAPLRVFAMALVWLGCVIIPLVRWTKSPMGLLRWDSRAWHWSGFGDNSVCRLAVCMDWQRLVLVVLRCDAHPPVWLWLGACQDSMQWNALRRAIMTAPLDKHEPGSDRVLPASRSTL